MLSMFSLRLVSCLMSWATAAFNNTTFFFQPDLTRSSICAKRTAGVRMTRTKFQGAPE